MCTMNIHELIGFPKYFERNLFFCGISTFRLVQVVHHVLQTMNPDDRDLRLVLLAVLVVLFFILQIRPPIPVTWILTGEQKSSWNKR